MLYYGLSTLYTLLVGKMKFLFGLITFFIFNVSVFAVNEQYTIYIDAGSSGSRLYLFQYDTTKSLPEVKEIFSKQVQPGLSFYADSPQEVGLSLSPLFDDTLQFLSSKAIKPENILVHLLATAGMRLLSEEKQGAIYAHAAHFIKEHYPFQIAELKTISGRAEGLYGWLGINYLLGNFQTHSETAGSIDMGGASTQISFATEEPGNSEDFIPLTINEHHYTVFSKSFLGLGQNEADQIMRRNKDASRCFPENYGFNPESFGYFDMESCASLYSSIIQQQQVEQQLIHLPAQAFIAYSSIYFTYQFFNATGQTDQAFFEARIKSICSKTWSQLQHEYPHESEKYLAMYCAHGIFFDELLYKIYKLQDTQLKVMNQINQQNIDWALGAALYNLTN